MTEQEIRLEQTKKVFNTIATLISNNETCTYRYLIYDLLKFEHGDYVELIDGIVITNMLVDYQKMKKENEDLRESEWAWHQLLKIQNKREYRSKFLKEFQTEYGKNVMPDYDEIYKRYDKLKKENERLKEQNNDLRKIYRNTYQRLFDNGNDELARYFQAQIDDCPTFYVEPIIDYHKEWKDYKSRNEKAIDKIQYIIDYGFDYDGFNTVESLKGLIDMLVDYARQSKNILNDVDEK